LCRLRTAGSEAKTPSPPATIPARRRIRGIRIRCRMMGRKRGIIKEGGKMAFCRKCGIEMTPGQNFCKKCGTAVREVAGVPTPIAPKPQSYYPASQQQRGPKPGGYLEDIRQSQNPQPPYKAVFATLAGIASILWAAIMFLLVCLQLFLAVGQSSATFAALGFWNALIAVLYLAIAIGIFMKKKWAWDWGIGSNSLNMIFGIYQVFVGAWINVVFLPIELFILIALEVSKSVVQEKKPIIDGVI